MFLHSFFFYYFWGQCLRNIFRPSQRGNTGTLDVVKTFMALMQLHHSALKLMTRLSFFQVISCLSVSSNRATELRNCKERLATHLCLLLHRNINIIHIRLLLCTVMVIHFEPVSTHYFSHFVPAHDTTNLFLIDSCFSKCSYAANDCK